MNNSLSKIYGDNIAGLITPYLRFKERFFITQGDWIRRVHRYMRDTYTKKDIKAIFGELIDQFVNGKVEYPNLLRYSDHLKPWKDHIILFDDDNNDNFFTEYDVSLPLRGFLEHIVDYDLMTEQELKPILESYFSLDIYMVEYKGRNLTFFL